ncbi:MAG: hypothetical protein OXH64_09100 [Rhodospirillaceae bacterium]|nr:hypothetical protein [Rhodospirillaceae bacterium]
MYVPVCQLIIIDPLTLVFVLSTNITGTFRPKYHLPSFPSAACAPAVKPGRKAKRECRRRNPAAGDFR